MTLSRRVAVIVSQEAAESLATFDLALRLADFLTWINQLIAQSLMVPLSVIEPNNTMPISRCFAKSVIAGIRGSERTLLSFVNSRSQDNHLSIVDLRMAR